MKDDLKAFLKSPSAKAQAAAAMKPTKEKGTTTAKTATTTASNLKQAEKIKAAKKTQSKLSAPGELARCRAHVGGDWRAGMLLYRIAHLWRALETKMKRGGREYIAMSRADWAMSAGLTDSELIKYALPRLRKYSHSIVTIEAMGSGKDKKLWVSLDTAGYREAMDIAGYELKIAAHIAPISLP